MSAAVGDRLVAVLVAWTPPGPASWNCAPPGHSIDEITAVLVAESTPLNVTGFAEVIADEGLPRP